MLGVVPDMLCESLYAELSRTNNFLAHILLL